MNTYFSVSNIVKIAGVVVFTLLGIVSTASADFSQKEWRVYKEIRLPSDIDSTTLLRVPLDQEVFATSTSNLRDLRVVGVDNKEVPYLLITNRDDIQSSVLSPKILNKGSVAGQSTSFVADFGGATFHNQITLNIDNELKNYRKKVQIYGSTDMSTWQLLADNQIIYDYSRDFPIRNTTVSYPESTYRYVLVKITDTESAPVSVVGVSASRDVYAKGNRLAYKPVFEWAEVGKDTEIVTDLGQTGTLTDRVTIATDSKNFERSVTVYSSNDKSTWSYLGGDVIYQYKTRELSGEKTTVTYSESVARYIKLVVHNQDSQPIHVTGVSASGYSRAIAFLGEPQAAYRLFYGNEKAMMSSYDLASVYRNFRADEFMIGALGPEHRNSEYVPPVIPLSERKPWVLGVMLGIVAVLLGLVIFRVVKKTAGLPNAQ
ncbi:DUF3999 family protein [Patescibacteria group bacterium]|nr:MAG: DUF3999 family protein [Patescibacteria group bacterium]